MIASKDLLCPAPFAPRLRLGFLFLVLFVSSFLTSWVFVVLAMVRPHGATRETLHYVTALLPGPHGAAREISGQGTRMANATLWLLARTQPRSRDHDYVYPFLELKRLR